MMIIQEAAGMDMMIIPEVEAEADTEVDMTITHQAMDILQEAVVDSAVDTMITRQAEVVDTEAMDHHSQQAYLEDS